MDAILGALVPLVQAWLKPEYLLIFAVLGPAIKTILPVVRSLIPAASHDPKGKTSLWLAFGLSAITTFVYKGIQHIGGWTVPEVFMTLGVTVLVACSAIGFNITIQAVKGQNVNIPKTE
jgi:hypothetical protein